MLGKRRKFLTVNPEDKVSVFPIAVQLVGEVSMRQAEVGICSL